MAAQTTLPGNLARSQVRGRILELQTYPHVARIGTVAALASNGADALLLDTMFVAPFDLTVNAVSRTAQATAVTVGTATSSASYRRFNLVNLGSAGTGTTVIASQNNTASNAATALTGAFALTTNNTVSAGEIIACSHLSVGAATANGTDAAAGNFILSYSRL